MPSSQPLRIRVLVFGAFDIFHPGHRSFFRQAKKLGTELVVAVGRERVITHIKRRRPIHSEQERLARVVEEPLVDRAVLAPRDPRRRYAFIRKLRPQIIALGHDQATYTTTLVTDLQRQKIQCQVVRLRPFQRQRYRSSLLRQKISSNR